MLNIELQSCGLAMLVVLLLIFIKQKSLDLSSRKLFFRALMASFVCIELDIISIIGIYFATQSAFPRFLAEIICKLYIVSLVFMTYQAFLYTAGEFFFDHRHSTIRIFYGAIFWIALPLMLLMPIDYVMEGRVVYSYGISVVAAYAFAFIYIGSTLFMSFKKTGLSSKRRRRAILLWQLSWMFAGMLQLLYPQLLLAGFSAAFGIMLLYAELENPHEWIDRNTGLFTANALNVYVSDRYQQSKKFASMHIRLEYMSEKVDLETEKTVMLRCGDYLDKMTEGIVFRESDNCYVLIYKDGMAMEEEYAKIADEIEEAINLPVTPSFVLMPESDIVNSADEFFRFHHFCEKENDGLSCMVANADAVNRLRRYNVVREIIRAALDEKRVEVYYQPFYDLQKEKFTVAEALVRIRNTDGKLIPPGVFVPIAEANGMIVPLGTEIFRQVCEFLSDGKAQKFGLEGIEVNLSVAQFDKGDPVEFVQNIMEEYHTDPKWINLEITETVSSNTKRKLITNMKRLSKLGINFSLDDFGTGSSNLDYMVEMPIDRIKFDFSFTQRYFKSEKMRYAVESIVSLARKMNLSVVAEGVETKEQLDAMRKLGVNYIQGYYFSKPVSREEFVEFLEKENAE